MFRVMLADDEPIGLEGLQLLVDWEKEGFAVCAACDNGEAALDALDTARPDLIVTDLRMPRVDGLTLMRRARERGFRGLFVIVSGYGDFSYAQEALRIGVSGYLLKPIDPAEAAEVLERVRTELVERELGQGGALPFAPWQQAMTELLMGGDGAGLPEGGQWRLSTWGEPLDFDTVAAGADACAREGVQASAHVLDGVELLALHAESLSADGLPAPIAEALAAREREALHGSVTDDPRDLRRDYQALLLRMSEAAAALPAYVREAEEAVSLRREDAFLSAADALERFCAAHGCRKRGRMLFQAECVRLLGERSEAVAALMTLPRGDARTVGLETMRLLAPARERISDAAMAYAGERFAEPLTLESVADALGYNATYLGRVFREETGVGFRAWLNQTRVEKAAELLRAENTPVHQVADRVGYPQYKLFLAHFKQRYGMTPEQYRRSTRA